MDKEWSEHPTDRYFFKNLKRGVGRKFLKHWFSLYLWLRFISTHKAFPFSSPGCRRHFSVVWMNLPGDQAPVRTGQEDLLHRVLPINCSDTRVDEPDVVSEWQWSYYDGDGHMYYDVQIVQIFSFRRILHPSRRKGRCRTRRWKLRGAK